MSLDLYIFRIINGLAGKLWFLDWIGIFLAQYLAYILVFAFLFFLLKEKNWKKRLYFLALVALSVILARGIITEVIRFIYPRPRPFTVLQLQPLIGESAYGSLPSGHATAFFALAFAVFYFFRDFASREIANKWGLWFSIAALSMGIGRIFAGVHWPSDILGGAIIGFASVLIVRQILPAKLSFSSNSQNGSN